MSGLEVLAVVAAVAAVVSAFNDGSNLTEKCRQKWNLIKDKKQQKKKQEQEEQSMVKLHDCLSSGQTRISTCYNEHYKAMGQIFAEGDAIAAYQLKDIRLQLLQEIVLNLRDERVVINYQSFQSTAQTSQEQAVDCLSSLRQRLLLQAPVPASLPWQPQHMPRPSRQYTPGFITEIGEIVPDSLRSGPSIRSSIDTNILPVQRRESTVVTDVVTPPLDHDIDNPWRDEISPSSRPTNPIDIHRPQVVPISAITSASNSYEPTRSDILTPISSRASTLPKSRSPEMSRSPPQSASSSFLRRASDRLFKRPSIGNNTTSPTDVGSPVTAPATPLHDRNIPLDALPSDRNNYLGLCASAWLYQIGQDSKAMTKTSRPSEGAIFAQYRHWICKSRNCRFEGKIERDKDTGREQVSRQIVRYGGGKIYFRWAFMFKNHLPAKSREDKTFGCVFCAHSKSKTLPAFGGERTFLNHVLEAHHGEGNWPEGAVLYRVRCVVSKTWPEDNSWDILLMDREEGASEGSGSPEYGSSLMMGSGAGSVFELDDPDPKELEAIETRREELETVEVRAPEPHRHDGTAQTQDNLALRSSSVSYPTSTDTFFDVACSPETLDKRLENVHLARQDYGIPAVPGVSAISNECGNGVNRRTAAQGQWLSLNY